MASSTRPRILLSFFGADLEEQQHRHQKSFLLNSILVAVVIYSQLNSSSEIFLELRKSQAQKIRLSA